MKRYILLAVITFAFGTTNSVAQDKGKSLKDTTKTDDTIEFYEVEIEGRQKNYRELLVGEWLIDTMRSQARAKPDALSSVVLSFQSDSTFSISSKCSNVSGTYRLKGTGISFSIIDASKITCEQPDQDFLLQKLLMQRVSAYTVENNILLLRDGSSNVVFRTSRKKSQ
jgi:heat shock protein HslJ